MPCSSPSSTIRRLWFLPALAASLASPGLTLRASDRLGGVRPREAGGARLGGRPVRPAVAAAVRVRARWPLPAGPAVAVLGWHRVDVEGGRLAVPPSLFARQMEILDEHRQQFPVTHLDHARRCWRRERQARRVVLTFDDAWADNHAHALGPLSRHRLPATLYAPSRLLGTPGYMTRSPAAGDGRRRRDDRRA